MEIESPVPFPEEFHALINSREFKRTLIIWIKYSKQLSNKEIVEHSGESYHNVQNAIDKWTS